MHASRRRFVRWSGAAALVGTLAWSRRAHAAQLEAEASLDTDRARVGEPVTLTLTVRASGRRSAPRPSLPTALEHGFDIVDTSESNRASTVMSSDGLQTIALREIQIVIVPLEPGRFELGYVVEDGGIKVESNVPVLEVVEAQARLPGDPAPGTGPTEALGDLFVWASVDKTTAYVGEQVTYMLDAYQRRRMMGVEARKPPSFQDFFSEALPDGRPRREIVAEESFEVAPLLRRALFPQKAGRLEIGSAEVLVGFARRRLASPAITVEVLPLPSAGQPPGFSPNNVGKWTIATAVDRTELDPGDPFTLTVTIEGDGNLKLIDPGSWPTIAGTRRYDPKIETTAREGRVIGGIRRYHFLLVPETTGPIVIPEHVFHFFDPEAGEYRESRAASLEVVVKGAAPVAAPSEEEQTQADEEIAALMSGTTLERQPVRERWLDASRWAWGMIGVPVTAIGVAMARVIVQRWAGDDAARQRARDKARRKQRLQAADEAVETGQGFHSELAGLLQELAVRRAGPGGVGLPRPELVRLLARRGVPAEDLATLQRLLEACDAARFAALKGTASERRALLDDAMALVRDSGLAREGEP